MLRNHRREERLRLLVGLRHLRRAHAPTLAQARRAGDPQVPRTTLVVRAMEETAGSEDRGRTRARRIAGAMIAAIVLLQVGHLVFGVSTGSLTDQGGVIDVV